MARKLATLLYLFWILHLSNSHQLEVDQSLKTRFAIDDLSQSEEEWLNALFGEYGSRDRSSGTLPMSTTTMVLTALIAVATAMVFLAVFYYVVSAFVSDCFGCNRRSRCGTPSDVTPSSQSTEISS